MNILISTETYFPWITGVSVSTDNIANYMGRQGHKVMLVCPKQRFPGEIPKHKNVEVVIIPALPFYFNKNYPSVFIPSAVRAINKLMKETKYDIVHIQEPITVGVATLISAKINKVPVFGAMHFIPEQVDRLLGSASEMVFTPVIRAFMRTIYNKYDGIMTPSHFFADYLKRVGVSKPINVVSNGTDVNLFKPGPVNNELRKKLGFIPNDFIYFFLGRLDKDKNVETLVRAMPYTKNDVKLLVVGKGTEKEYLTKLSQRLNISEKIVWVDYITDSEMSDYYHAANAFAIMSPYEGQSIVTLQAIATGLPVIAANASALPELCKDDVNGYLVNSYDYRTLAQKMDFIAGNKSLQKKFGEKSREISLPHSRPEVLHKLEHIYKDIISEKAMGKI